MQILPLRLQSSFRDKRKNSGSLNFRKKAIHNGSWFHTLKSNHSYNRVKCECFLIGSVFFETLINALNRSTETIEVSLQENFY